MTGLAIFYGVGAVAVIWVGWLFLCRRHDALGPACVVVALALGWPLVALAIVGNALFERVARAVGRRLMGGPT